MPSDPYAEQREYDEGQRLRDAAIEGTINIPIEERLGNGIYTLENLRFGYTEFATFGVGSSVEVQHADGTIERYPVTTYGGTIMSLEDSESVARGPILSREERLFMFSRADRIEYELRWLRLNNVTVAHCYREARLAHLSETTAAEMAVICLARENEDLRRRLSRCAHGPRNETGP